ncbi:MAG: succinate dehydrogenase assembly factor 2 [Rickettsiaceae bacterium]|nr:MAG: succinate dehydrogenase assembly factor 2 [Rickettsiaceae bacterium]
MIDYKKENLIRKINYRSRNRGNRENSIILSKFCYQSLRSMSLYELNNFYNLLNENDLDIYQWLTENDCPIKSYSEIINKISQFNFTNDSTK